MIMVACERDLVVLLTLSPVKHITVLFHTFRFLTLCIKSNMINAFELLFLQWHIYETICLRCTCSNHIQSNQGMSLRLYLQVLKDSEEDIRL